MTINDILKYTGGILLQGSAAKKVSGISTDTRTLKKGQLFVALIGKNFDGHKFLDDAAKKQAAAFLISRKVLIPKGVTAILCKDTTTAYSDIASGYRSRFKIPVVGITGSVGKTTTKELMAEVLSKRFCILKNYMTENNEIGVSKTLFKLTPYHQAVVLEFGTNHFGEIERLSAVGQPTIAVLTTIGDSHLEFLKNKQGVFREKSKIFLRTKTCHAVVYNNDDPWLRKISCLAGRLRKITFGIDTPAKFRAQKIAYSQTGLSFYVGRERFSLKTLSRENIYNALAVIAVGRLLGISYESIRRSLACAAFPKGRQNITRADGVWLIDDTYNANPTSVASALHTLSRFPSKGKRFFVFGDMLELGKASASAHRKIGNLAIKHHVDHLFTFGRWSKLASNAVEKKIASHHFVSHKNIVSVLKKNVCPGDVILFKGSRGMHMEKAVEMFKK